MIQKVLPASLTEARAEKLAERLVKRCRFMPSIAEISEEWSLMARDCRASHQPQEVSGVRKPRQELLKRIEAIRRDAASGKKFPEPVITQEVREFARTYFPDISEETIRRNWQDITSCRSENAKQMKTNSRYWTVMKMSRDGTIELMMREIA